MSPASANSRIMYIEFKGGGLTGPARIGRVRYSKSGATLEYGGKKFRSQKGYGFKSNYYDVASGEAYWISGPRRDGDDRLYSERVPVAIDEDVREEYWTTIRRSPERANERFTSSKGAPKESGRKAPSELPATSAPVRRRWNARSWNAPGPSSSAS